MSKSTWRKTIPLFVVSSIVAGVILQPIGAWLLRLLLSSSGNFYQSYVDALYSNAALGQRDWIDALFVIIGFIFLSSTAIALAIVRFVLNDIDPDDAHFSIDKVPSPIRQMIEPNRITKGIFILMFFVAWLQILSTTVRVFTDLQLNTSFEQRLTVLAPHIDDHEEEVIRANWAMMDSRSDYVDLNLLLETRAKEYLIELPEPLAGG